MNRELVTYYNNNNYEIYSANAGRYICQTILDTYPALNLAVRDILDIQSRHMQSKAPTRPWVCLYFVFTIIVFNINFIVYFSHF